MARNKWFIGHPEGRCEVNAFLGLTGANLDTKIDIVIIIINKAGGRQPALFYSWETFTETASSYKDKYTGIP